MYKVIGIDNKVYGPITADQLRQWMAEGRVNNSTLIQPEGVNEWRPLSSLHGFTVPPVVSMPPAVHGETGKGMAIASLILGITSNVCCCFGVICAVLGIVFSVIALSQHETYPGQRGRNMAIAGLILSVLGLGWHLLLPLIFGAVQGPWMWPHARWHYL